MLVATAVDEDPTAPSAEGLTRVADLLAATSVERVSRLRGGAASLVHGVELLAAGRVNSVVVKRFAVGDQTAGFEWDALQFVRRSRIRAPEPLAFDPGGSWFGAPAILMSFLPGRPAPWATDVGRWTTELASCLATIHETSAEGAPVAMLRPAMWDRWTSGRLPPGPRTEAIAGAIDALRQIRWESGLCHGDFHPANVLFEADAASGVVDWISARRGPFLSDVGRCRAALAVWPGGAAGAQFTAGYASLTGRSLDGLAYWDVLSGAVSLLYEQRWMSIYRSLGLSLEPGLARLRLLTFIDAALKRLKR